jgi:hypothetical protein
MASKRKPAARGRAGRPATARRPAASKAKPRSSKPKRAKPRAAKARPATRTKPRAAKARPRRPPAAAEPAVPFDDLLVATAAGCLDQEVATDLVFGCIPNGAVPLDTALGTLFADVARRGFCGCVFGKATAAGAAISEGDIPCTATTTVGEVIDAISC